MEFASRRPYTNWRVPAKASFARRKGNGNQSVRVFAFGGMLWNRIMHTWGSLYVSLRAKAKDRMPFRKYASAAQSLALDASVARALVDAQRRKNRMAKG